MGVILGPIIGPALGGWLTDEYNWRWVFFINVPFGLLAAAGILTFIRETRHAHREAFDFFGFATLSLAIGALQMFLDRGELKDWFGSTEIWVEATIAGLAFYLFVVHTATATDRSFLNRDLLKDTNCAVGTILMFLVAIPLFGTMVLLPTMLQDLLNYPVLTTGLVLVPRGAAGRSSCERCSRCWKISTMSWKKPPPASVPGSGRRSFVSSIPRFSPQRSPASH